MIHRFWCKQIFVLFSLPEFHPVGKGNKCVFNLCLSSWWLIWWLQWLCYWWQRQSTLVPRFDHDDWWWQRWLCYWSQWQSTLVVLMMITVIMLLITMTIYLDDDHDELLLMFININATADNDNLPWWFCCPACSCQSLSQPLFLGTSRIGVDGSYLNLLRLKLESLFIQMKWKFKPSDSGVDQESKFNLHSSLYKISWLYGLLFAYGPKKLLQWVRGE